MAYPKQKSWLKRMERDTIGSSRIAEERETARLRTMWEATKYTMKSRIREEYRKAFAHGVWDLSRARSSGALVRIQKHTTACLDLFGASAAPFMATHLNQAKKERVLRLAWMLDMTSPPMVRPKVGGARLRLKEANVTGSVHVYSGPEAEASWLERFGEWLRGYDESLNRNITLGALNNSTPDDAAQEVDAARTGNRSMDFWDKIDSIFRNERQRAEAEGSVMFGAENEDMLAEEIWQAEGDEATCEDCDELDGYSRADAEKGGDTIPLHPNCRCYWRIVPKAWSEYLRSLDPEQARALDDKGIAPDAMALRDPETGKIGGLIWIDFKDWQGNIVGAK